MFDGLAVLCEAPITPRVCLYLVGYIREKQSFGCSFAFCFVICLLWGFVPD